MSNSQSKFGGGSKIGSITSRCSGKWARTHPIKIKTGPGRRRKSSLGPRQRRTTREVEVIWWPDLYSTTRNGKLSIRLYIKKVTVWNSFLWSFFAVYSILTKHSDNGFKVDFTSLKYLGSCFSSIFYLQRAVLIVKLPCLTCTEVNFAFLFFSPSLKCKLDIEIILFTKV